MLSKCFFHIKAPYQNAEGTNVTMTILFSSLQNMQKWLHSAV